MAPPDAPEPREGVRPHPTLTRYYDDEAGRKEFVRDIFDRTATDYDLVERWMALGTGSWYRRQALLRAGLQVGMRVLDVAVGTGLVAREAIAVVGGSGTVIGVDPSAGMLCQARRSLPLGTAMGMGEELPIRDASFDFISMGYALRHLADLAVAFREFRRVLRPGGTVCILELTPPGNLLARGVLRAYVRGVIPLFARLRGRRVETAQLWQYFWDTMDACVQPERVMETLAATGFTGVQRYLEIRLFSEYTGCKPA